MKWFKHYTNAHKGGLLQDLYAGFGINEGYGLYFRFVEYCCDKWDGTSDPEFKFLVLELRNFLGISPKKLQKFAGILAESEKITFKISGEFCHITFPKLVEIRHKDALPSQIRPASGPPQARLEQNKNKNKNNTHKSASVSEVLKNHPARSFETNFTFDFEAVYRAYPKPIENKLTAKMKLGQIFAQKGNYERFLIAVEKYAAHCEAEGIQPRYRKNILSFCESWEFWENPPDEMNAVDVMAEAKKLIEAKQAGGQQ